jgi:hypothetical protein
MVVAQGDVLAVTMRSIVRMIAASRLLAALNERMRGRPQGRPR